MEKLNNNINIQQQCSSWVGYPYKCPNCGGDQEYDVSRCLTSNPPQYEVRCKKCGHISYSGSYTITPYTPDPCLPIHPGPSLPSYPSPGLPRPFDQPQRPSYGGSYGWICPNCGKVWAPHIDFCDCGNNWNRFTCDTSVDVPPYKGSTTISTFVGDTIVGSGGTNEGLSTVQVCDKNSITAVLNVPEFDKQSKREGKVETDGNLEV